MQIVVTGAAGFVGSHLCEALVSDGHDVHGIDAFIPYYSPAIKRANLLALANHPKFTFSEADLRVDDLECLIEGADVIVHEAAMPGLPRSWSDFELYVSCNLIATQRLLEAAKTVGIGRFIQASTSSVYGAQAVGDENVPTNPISPYGVTKLAAEHLVRAFAVSFGIPSIILRYFSIYGPRQRPDMAFSRFIAALERNEPIVVYGDGSQSRSCTHVSDCVRGTALAIADGVPGEAYNIGGGEPLTVLNAIEMIADAMGAEPELRFEAPRLGDQRHTRANWGKAAATFGYEPQVNPREGLRQQVKWQLDQSRTGRRP